ncbi:MAG: polysaccharide biosynthesis tyrosine autokinase [Ardenticatenaceae bacterium]|nr:polysaccharide biosynthesis tyrosine autokinase [Anaerolineales bacterium]MCB8923762.1 polysaccharide biosynthesis tyrosine autokinase [Ardenticatenaceae bacterium]MCB8990097.1 polysaccharide biosynthesis tyrosine autokinase [Ardenticatenaceae bacterium]
MEIKEYFTPLLKWWWLVLLSTLIAGVTSFIVAAQQPSLFSTTATIIVGNAIEDLNPSNTDLSITQQLASFYVDLANRSSVRNDAREALGLNALPRDIFVQQLNNTNVIDIIVQDTDAARAQAVANELAHQLILRSPSAQENDQERQDFVNEQLDTYEKAIQDAEQQLSDKQEELGTLTSAREIRQVQNDISSLESSLQTLRRDYSSLLGNTQQGATNTIRVIEAAPLPKQPVNSNNMLSVVTAAGVGFVLAVSAAFVLEYLDDTISLPSQVNRLTELPTLAGIAEIKEDILVTVQHARSPTAEAFRVLRTGIQFSAVDNPGRTLLVTSATPLDGKSTIAANLAVVLAQAGNRVLFADADLRCPSQHEIFNMPNKRGLSTLLLDFDTAQQEEEVKLMVKDNAQATRVEGLFLLTSGPIPPNPSELLGSIKMKRLLEELLKQFDYIVFDSPPVLSVTDSVVLSTQVDGTLVVVRAHKTRRGHIKQMVQTLREVNANVIGTILNSLHPKGDGYDSYYYYKNPYYAQDDESENPDTDDKPRGKLRKRLVRSGEAKNLVSQ